VPLRLRMALLVGMIASLLVGIASLLFFDQFSDDMLRSVDDGLDRQSQVWRQLLADGEPDQPGVRSSDEVIQVLAADGAVLLASRAAGRAPLLTPDRLARAARQRLRLTVGEEQGAIRVLAQPLPAGSDSGGSVLLIGTPLEPVEVTEHRVQHLALAGGVPAVLLAVLGAWLLAGAALRPVERMRSQAAAIGSRQPGGRLAVPATRDELARLADTFNSLLDRLEDSLSRERGFVADAGHELRTPLTILAAELELAARPGRSSQQLTEALGVAQDETQRLIRLAEDLLLLARAQGGPGLLNPVPVAVGEVVGPAVRGAAALAHDRDVRVTGHGDLEPTVTLDPDRVREALDNLLENALRHTPSGGRIRVVAAVDRPAGELRLVVQDSGEGFVEGFLPQAFGRFQRADKARSRADGGTGLGLSIVRAIALAHGGRVTAANRPEGGAEVTLALPLDAPPT
jgi:two-component system, OmpR family, sensor kinase